MVVLWCERSGGGDKTHMEYLRWWKDPQRLSYYPLSHSRSPDHCNLHAYCYLRNYTVRSVSWHLAMGVEQCSIDHTLGKYKAKENTRNPGFLSFIQTHITSLMFDWGVQFIVLWLCFSDCLLYLTFRMMRGQLSCQDYDFVLEFMLVLFFPHET